MKGETFMKRAIILIVLLVGFCLNSSANELENNYDFYSLPEAESMSMMQAIMEMKNGLVYEVTNEKTITITQFFEQTNELQELCIPETIAGHPVTTIRGLAIGTNTSIIHIQIPSTVSKIEPGCFRGFSSLQTVTVESENPYFATLNGALCNKQEKSILYYPVQKADKVFYIPEGILGIEKFSFWNNRFIECLDIPMSVTDVGENPFVGCTELRSITIASNNSVYAFQNSALIQLTENKLISLLSYDKVQHYLVPEQIQVIGQYAFAENNNLWKVTLPETLQTIEAYAFYSCENLSEILHGNSLKEIGANAFRWCNNLKLFRSSDSFSFYQPDEQLYIDIPPTVVQIDEYAFAQSGIYNINIPDSVSAMGNGLFMNCSELITAKIHANVSSLPAYTFSQCAELETVDLSPSLLSIEEAAFNDCKRLSSITLPSELQYIGQDAFSNCEMLQTISFPDNLRTVDHHAFYFCVSLYQVEVPNTITYIAPDSFEGCSEEINASIRERVINQKLENYPVLETALETQINLDNTVSLFVSSISFDDTTCAGSSILYVEARILNNSSESVLVNDNIQMDIVYRENVKFPLICTRYSNAKNNNWIDASPSGDFDCCPLMEYRTIWHSEVPSLLKSVPQGEVYLYIYTPKQNYKIPIYFHK